MEWTTERRYRLYQDWTQEEIQNIKKIWHNLHGILITMLSQKQDFSTNPNGFSYFDGKWILFYQNFPFGAAHGLKSLVQLESEDLVHSQKLVSKFCLILH